MQFRYSDTKKVKYCFVFLTLIPMASIGCSFNVMDGFDASASFVESNNRYIIRFPLTDSGQDPKYISGLAIQIKDLMSAHLDYAREGDFVLSEVSIYKSHIDSTRFIASYNFGDEHGSIVSFCANWKSLSLKELLNNKKDA